MNKLKDLFDTTEAAGEYTVLPAGEYTAVITKRERTRSRNGHQAYKVTFRVCDGPHDGHLFWHELYFTENAMPYTKRDLLKLEITTADQLDKPLPRFRCAAKLIVRTSGAGEHNRVSTFTVLGEDEPTPDPFAPKPKPMPVDRSPTDVDKKLKRKGVKR